MRTHVLLAAALFMPGLAIADSPSKNDAKTVQTVAPLPTKAQHAQPQHRDNAPNGNRFTTGPYDDRDAELPNQVRTPPIDDFDTPVDQEPDWETREKQKAESLEHAHDKPDAGDWSAPTSVGGHFHIGGGHMKTAH